jgi:hypothetical protein
MMTYWFVAGTSTSTSLCHLQAGKYPHNEKIFSDEPSGLIEAYSF